MKIINKYTPTNKPILLGFIISLMGALPLGYINVISLQILLEQGNWATVSFIFGIIFIEFFVLKIVSRIAKWLVEQKKLVLFIDVFTIIFFLAIATYFFSNINNTKNFSLSALELATYPFFLGITLNTFNFIQWPYWSGIYVFLFREEKLNQDAKSQNWFVFGALVGTMVGMLVFAHTGKYILVENKIEIGKYINTIFALLFLILGVAQLVKLIFKNRKSTFLKVEINKQK